MPNYMAEAFAPAEAHYKSLIMRETWGHLFPSKPQYRGKVRIANGLYGSSSGIIIDEKDLPQSSPWWYETLTDFAYEVSKDMDTGEVAEFYIQVDIVQCVEELEDWELEELKELETEPESWLEIHIKQLKKQIILKPW